MSAGPGYEGWWLLDDSHAECPNCRKQIFGGSYLADLLSVIERHECPEKDGAS